MQLFFVAFIASVGLTYVQSNNGMATDPNEVQNKFRGFFDSLKTNDMKKTDTYRHFLEEEAVREQRAFDTIKEEFKFTRQKNAQKIINLDHKSGDIGRGVAVVKREASPKPENLSISISVITATPQHLSSLIFLHGLDRTGDMTGAAWLRVLEPLRGSHVRVICPTAHQIPLTIDRNASYHSWFDVIGLERDDPEDVEGIKRAVRYVHSLIEEEMNLGISSSRIMVGGHAQGGAAALYAALTYPKKLAGVLALSTYMPARDTFSPSMITANKDMPVLLCYGDRDGIVEDQFGKLTRRLLKPLLPKFQFKRYVNLMFDDSDENTDDIKHFIETNLPAVWFQE